MKIGLKLWSTNEFYKAPANDLFSRGLIDFIELMVVRYSFERFGGLWKDISIPYGLHAPHSYAGLNFSLPEKEKENIAACHDVVRYAELLVAEYVVFHPGIIGVETETIRQIKVCQKLFPSIFRNALIENKPQFGLKGEKCLGASPLEIKIIQEQTGIGFCLDVSHACCYAASANRNWKEIIEQFVELKPEIIHFSDGHSDSIIDEHLHLGYGDYDIVWLKEIVGQNNYVVIETDKNYPDRLDDFVNDVVVLDPNRVKKTHK